MPNSLNSEIGKPGRTLTLFGRAPGVRLLGSVGIRHQALWNPANPWQGLYLRGVKRPIVYKGPLFQLVAIRACR